ncbi:MAG: hypothetical protein NPIRA05_01250 [Nitrospirales bacterium]|nr:MAG: hypothetical protein NPIRA05_01250 [Nitrospirales bacterium]
MIVKISMESAFSIRKKFLIVLSLLVLSVTISVLFYFVPALNPTPDPHDVWFQRSGSFVVIIAIWAETILIQTEGYIDPYNEKHSTYDEVPYEFNFHYAKLEKWIFFLILAGTLVWGYGDLLL